MLLYLFLIHKPPIVLPTVISMKQLLLNRKTDFAEKNVLETSGVALCK